LSGGNSGTVHWGDSDLVVKHNWWGKQSEQFVIRCLSGGNSGTVHWGDSDLVVKNNWWGKFVA
jgi:hypothetical protein